MSKEKVKKMTFIINEDIYNSYKEICKELDSDVSKSLREHMRQKVATYYEEKANAIKEGIIDTDGNYL